MTLNGAKRKAIDLAEAAATTHRRLLERYLRRRLQRKSDLDDLAQEVYGRLLKIKDEKTIEELRDPVAFVFSVAAKVMVDWHRAAGRTIRGVSLDDVDDGTIESLHHEMDNPAEQIAREQHIEHVWGMLPPIQRAALTLRVRDRMSFKDIGRELKLSESMAKYHVTRAWARIRSTSMDR